ncbi:MAG TPA: 4,5-DOPA dioxygenase extradiol [Anaerolineae bacterium]|jgi:4,5-DOPA dioxygenase extradiol
MDLKDLHQMTENLEKTDTMPVLFLGHGSPMNAIEDNEFSRSWRELGKTLPRPKAILCVSAHWETKGTQVTINEQPPTIHDFGGFPRALFEVEYPAPGSQWLAHETKEAISNTEVLYADDWGLDHGTWSVVKPMFPDADVPVIQMSLDYSKPATWHYELAKQLAPLRQKGVLIIGSGNLVHNLRRVAIPPGAKFDFNVHYGLDWALEANALFKKLILENNHKELTNYKALGAAVQLAVPTPEHYLPALYALALKGENETITLFNDVATAGSLTMTSMKIE